MPNLIYNLEFKIDKAQLAELKNIVDASTTAEVSSLTDKVKSLEKQLKKLKGSQNELNKTDKERINLSKSQRSQINSLLKVKKTKTRTHSVLLFILLKENILYKNEIYYIFI